MKYHSLISDRYVLFFVLVSEYLSLSGFYVMIYLTVVRVFQQFCQKFSFFWYRAKNIFLLTESLSRLGWHILVYPSNVAFRFLFIDFSKLFTARTCVNCFRWGWVYYYFTEIVNFGNIKSKVFSLLWSNCQLKAELYWYINFHFNVTFICISQFGI